MKNGTTEKLIQLAWLEGWLSTRGAYEKAVTKRPVGAQVSAAARSTLLERLEGTLSETKPEKPLTIGLLLRSLRAERLLKPQEIFARIGVKQNIYRMLEQDAISPLKIPVEVWRRLMTLMNVSAADLSGMIRRTHRLVFFRPSFKGVLARYTSGSKKETKTAILEKAFSEMYAKASLAVPEEEEKKLNDLIRAL